MPKQLVRKGKAFSNLLIVAISLALCVPALGAPAAQNCDCPCAKGKKQTAATDTTAGQVTVVWPRDETFLGRTLHSKIEVQIDAAIVGAVDYDTPLTVSVPNGLHKLVVKQKNGYLDSLSKTYRVPDHGFHAKTALFPDR